MGFINITTVVEFAEFVMLMMLNIAARCKLEAKRHWRIRRTEDLKVQINVQSKSLPKKNKE